MYSLNCLKAKMKRNSIFISFVLVKNNVAHFGGPKQNVKKKIIFDNCSLKYSKRNMFGYFH